MRERSFLLLVLLVSCTEPRPYREPQPEPAPAAEADDGYREPAVVRREGNHLTGEPSPYLQQHAHNPVDWYPWGEEAIARARSLNRPIFLSIGYSTCHWCHVMEEESFENDEVAEYLNRHFVSIKVDREQRPDIDALYIDAVRQLGGSTGWPLTVMLTPELVPFFGGTYFPRESSRGRPGFLDVLRQVHDRFESEGAERVAQQGRRIFAQIERAARAGQGSAPVSAPLIDQAFRMLARSRDTQLGGFGTRQKFPNAPLLLAELRYVERTGDTAARQHLEITLDQAMRGGIRDHLYGTFHRYAVDRRWHVPHFEKTLYDNAQLAQVYVEAGLALERPEWVRVGREVLDDLIAHWQQSDGGFVVGFDADDPGGEGHYYTWTPAELRAAIGPEDAAAFATAYAVRPRGERLLEGRSVLHRLSDEELRTHTELTPEAVGALLARVRAPLVEVRDRRAPPAIDDKELASWNGLAIIALANVGRWLDEPRYVRAAQRAARFVLEACWVDGRMRRGLRQGESLGEGFLDDLAIPALGLLRLHAADGDERWLLGAFELATAIADRYQDPAQGTFLHTARADIPEGLPLRRPDLDDGVLPSGGNAATLLMLEIGAMAGQRAIYDLGERAARSSAPRAVRSPFGAGYLLVALDHLVAPSREVVLAGESEALWELVRPTRHSRVLPIRVTAAGASEALRSRFGALAGARPRSDGRATAYVCEIGRCELPTVDAAILRAQVAPVTGRTGTE